MLMASSMVMMPELKAEGNYDFQQNPINYPTDYYSAESMGCLLLQECTEGVVQISSQKDMEEYYGTSYDLGTEFDEMLQSLTKIGSNVYIAPEEYFPAGQLTHAEALCAVPAMTVLPAGQNVQEVLG